MRSISAERKGNKTVFGIWAPLKKKVDLHIVYPFDKRYTMTREEEGYWELELEDLPADTRYFFDADNQGDYPDPASQFQPEGVHGPSQVVDHITYSWNDSGWSGLQADELIIYELHVGTFTPEGNFEAIIPRLNELKEIGINAIELMPIAQFPGERNWGYDGVYSYAVQNSYGGPAGLKKLVDACHKNSIAVILDVVYNHVGPEGNCFPLFGPYFTNKYRTPWGDAINFDDEWSDGAREYFSNNALYWFEKYHIDGLRCDAIHMMFDNGALHFWELTNTKIQALKKRLGRPLYMIAESDTNSPRVTTPVQNGGYGFDIQWLDDFHHALCTLVDPKGKERYYDFGTIEQLAKAYNEGFVHSGEWTKFRNRRYGTSSVGVPGNKFIVFDNNHDQAGNRPQGERLNMLVDHERVKLSAAALLFSAYIPLLFMGEEYSDDTPFYYFVSHSDTKLTDAVKKGRQEEFKKYKYTAAPPDPQAETTFLNSKIQWQKRNTGYHSVMLDWYRELIRLRKKLDVFKTFEKKNILVEPVGPSAFVLRRRDADEKHSLIAFFNLSEKEICYDVPMQLNPARKILDSGESRWHVRANQQYAALFPTLIHPGDKIISSALSVVVYLEE